MLFFIFWLFSSFRYWEGIGAYPSAFPFLNYSNWVNRYILVKKHIQRFKQRYLPRVLLFYRHKKRSLVWEIKKSTGYFFLKASMQKLKVSLTTDNYPALFLASTKLCIEGKWAIFRSHWRLALQQMKLGLWFSVFGKDAREVIVKRECKNIPSDCIFA